MPYLLVKVDGTAVAGVVTDDFEVITVNVEGVSFAERYADLSVSGGTYSQELAIDHRTWVGGLELRAGQVVEVTLQQCGSPIGVGERSQKSQPNATHTLRADYCFSEAPADDQPLPRLKGAYTVRLLADAQEAAKLTTLSEEHGFMLRIFWNIVRPDSASVSLSTYVLENTDQHGRGRTLVQGRMSLGSGVRLELVA